MILSPKAGAVVGVAMGAALTAVTWYVAHYKGEVYLGLAMFGPALVVGCLPIAVLPPEKFMVAPEVNGRREFDTKNTKLTPLGRLMVVVGIAAGGLFYFYLRYGT